MVTHDPDEAETIGDWIGVMDGGRLVEWRPTRAVAVE